MNLIFGKPDLLCNDTQCCTKHVTNHTSRCGLTWSNSSTSLWRSRKNYIFHFQLAESSSELKQPQLITATKGRLCFLLIQENGLSEFSITNLDCVSTYLDSCVYYSPDFLQQNQHSQHHHTVEQDLYMSLTYSVILLHKSQNMLPSLSNRSSHHQLEIN
jgi:hypothetical protein